AEWQRDAGNVSAAAATSDQIAALVAGDPKLDAALAEGKRALESGDAHAASLKYRVAENLLRATPRYQQARRDVEPGVVGLPLEDWGPRTAAAVRAKAGAAVPVSFVPKPDAGLAALSGVAVLRVAGRDARDLAAAGTRGVAIAAAGASGYRV